jgi:hypothetical protein
MKANGHLVDPPPNSYAMRIRALCSRTSPVAEKDMTSTSTAYIWHFQYWDTQIGFPRGLLCMAMIFIR